MEIYFIEHGNTDWNDYEDPAKNTYLGKPIGGEWNPDNHPEWFELNEVGKARAEETARKLDGLLKDDTFDLYCSNKNRAKDSARYFLILRAEEDLALKVDPSLDEFSFDTGETPENALSRMNTFVNKRYLENPERTIVVYSHSREMSHYLSEISGKKVENIANGEIIRCDLSQKGTELELKVKERL